VANMALQRGRRASGPVRPDRPNYCVRSVTANGGGGRDLLPLTAAWPKARSVGPGLAVHGWGGRPVGSTVPPIAFLPLMQVLCCWLTSYNLLTPG
jgi:hypothetical protein